MELILMMKCRQKVVMGEAEGAETNNTRRMNELTQ